MEEEIREIIDYKEEFTEPAVTSPVICAEQPVPDEASRNAAIARSARKVFSRLGLGAFATMLISIGISVILAFIGMLAAPDFFRTASGVLILSIVSMHLTAIPLGCFIMRKVPRFIPETDKFGIASLLKCVPVCIFFAYAGNLIGTLLNELLYSILGLPYVDPVGSIVDSNLPLVVMVLTLVIIGPFMEELLFRKFLIERMRGYGERIAIICSALMFGLFHINLVQFTYASLLGLVFGYVYIRTSNIWYTFALHAFLNFYSGVLPTKLGSSTIVETFLNRLDDGHYEAAFQLLEDPYVLAFVIYIVITLLLAIAGLVLLIINRRKLRFSQAPLQIPKGKGFSSSWLNLGMQLFALSCVAYIIVSVVGSDLI